MVFLMFSSLGGLSDNSPPTFQQFFKRSRLTLAKAFFHIFHFINLMSGFHLNWWLHARYARTHTHTPPWKAPCSTHTPNLETLAPEASSLAHDLLMTSFFPGLFSSSTRASPTSLIVTNNKGLCIYGSLAAGSVGRQEQMMHLIHRLKAQFRCAELTGLSGHGALLGTTAFQKAGPRCEGGDYLLGCFRLGHTLHV